MNPHTFMMFGIPAALVASHWTAWAFGRDHAAKLAGDKVDAHAATRPASAVEAAVACSTPTVGAAVGACRQHASNLQKDAVDYMAYFDFVYRLMPGYLEDMIEHGSFIIDAVTDPWINNYPLRRAFTDLMRKHGICVSFRYNSGGVPNKMTLSAFKPGQVWHAGDEVPGTKKGEL